MRAMTAFFITGSTDGIGKLAARKLVEVDHLIRTPWMGLKQRLLLKQLKS